MRKRLVSLGLVVLFALSAGIIHVSAAETFLSEKDVINRLDELKNNAYPDGGRYTGSFGGGSQCYAFARLLANSVFGSYPWNCDAYYDGYVDGNGWELIVGPDSAEIIQPGDIIEVRNTGLHTAIVWKVSNSVISVAECWGSSNGEINWGSFNDAEKNATLAGLINTYGQSNVYVWKRPGAAMAMGPLSRCEASYSCNLDVTITKKSWLKSMPCADETDPESVVVRPGVIGETLHATKLYKNWVGNYWYEIEGVTNSTTGEKQTAYLYSGDGEAEFRWEDDIVSGASRPKLIRKGIDQFFAVKGVIDPEYLDVDYVWGYIKDSSGKVLYSGEEAIRPGYSLNYNAVDDNLLFGDLEPGNYTYELYVREINWSADENKLPNEPTKKKEKVFSCDFAVVDPTPVKYTVYFHDGLDNDYFKAVTITSGEKIGDLPEVESRFGYTFNRWYTGAKTVTEDYIITGNTHIYAEFQAKNYCVYFNTGAITGSEEYEYDITYGDQFGDLPVPSRDGFVFEGWFTEPEGGEQVKSTTYFRYNGEPTLKPHGEVSLYGMEDSEDVELPFDGDNRIMNLYAHWSVETGSGACGENLYWEINKGGVLTITGTGDMYDYASAKDVPWNKSREAISEIRLPSGLTDICDHAFSDVVNVTSVAIPYTVESIGDAAFAGCTELTRVDFYGDEPYMFLSDVFENCGEDFALYRRNDAGWDSDAEYIYKSLKCSHTYDVTTVEPTCVDEGYDRHVCSMCGDEYRDNYLEETGVHEYVYQAKENRITETCVSGCDHEESLTIAVSDDVYYYTGESIAPAKVRYSSGWEAGEQDILYTNNDMEGVATASVSVGGVTAYVNFTLIVPENLVEGTVGDWLSWAVREDGILFIECEGDMPQWSSENRPPWYTEELESGRLPLREIVVTGQTTSVGNYAFCSMSDVEQISLPDTIVKIGAHAFYGCRGVSNIDLPEALEYIGSSAFESCDSLKRLELPDQVSVIAGRAFEGCNDLKSLKLGAAIEIVSGSTFGGSDSLAEILVSENNPCYSSVDGVLYSKDQSSLIKYPPAKANAVFYVPNLVESIEGEAFYGNPYLQEVHIPYSVKGLSSYVFQASYNLDEVWFYGDVPSMGLDIFHYHTDDLTVYYPEGNETWPYAEWEEYSQIPFNCSHNGEDKVVAPTCSGAGYSGSVCMYCGEVLEKYSETPASGTHTLQYYGYRSTLTETCLYCDHSETAKISEPDGYYMYTGKEITPAIVSYSDGWLGGELNISYANNVEVGAAKATIQKNGAFAETTFFVEFEETFAHGVCGDNLTWRLTPTGILYIEGQGNMYDYDDEHAPWYDSWGIGPDTIIIGEGVRNIGNYAFDFFGQTEEIVIPDSVTKIGNHAFDGCESLTSINLPEHLASVGECAFSGCKGLTAIEIPASVWEIGEQAFSFCSNLENIQVAEENAYYSSSEGVLFSEDMKTLLLYPQEKAGRYAVPSGVVEIADYAFFRNEKLSGIDFPDSLESIGNMAFYACTALEQIDFPDNLDSIGAFAFEDCSALEQIDFPAGIELIPDDAFSGCFALKEVHFRGTPPLIENHAFDGITATVYYPEGVPGWTSDLLQNYGGNLTWEAVYANIFWSLSDDGVLTISGEGAMPDYDFEEAPWAASESKIKKVVVKEGILTVGNYAFEELSNLTEVNLPDGLISIGESAFIYCDNLSEINVPESVSEIGAGAFICCKELKEISIPGSVDRVEKTLFAGSEKLETVVLSEGVASIGENAFEGCSSLKKIHFPDSLVRIEAYAFWRAGLNEVTIPSAVAEIEEGAFCYCLDLKTLRFEGSAPKFGEDMAYYVTANVFYPSENETWTGVIKQNYGGTLAWMSIVASGTIDTMSWTLDAEGVLTLRGTGAMTGYICGDASGGYTIMPRPWSGYSDRIKTVVIENGITSIGSGAFLECRELKHIRLAESVSEIEKFAFYGCKSLLIASIEGEIAEIGESAFDGCDNLSRVFLMMPESRWEQIRLGEFNEELLASQMNFCSIGGIQADGLVWCYNFENAGMHLSKLSSMGVDLAGFDQTAWEKVAKETDALLIGKDVCDLEMAWFSNLTNLDEVAVENGSENYSANDGVLYDRNRTVLLYCPAKKENVEVLPGVRGIHRDAFFTCNDLKILRFQGNAPEIVGAGNAFALPKNVEVQYYADTTGWDQIPWTNYNLKPITRYALPIISVDANGVEIIVDTSEWPETVKNGSLYCGVYDANGKMLGLSSQNITVKEQRLFVKCDGQLAACGELFALLGDDNLLPAMPSIEFDC